MKFQLNDLIQVIGNKYNLDFSHTSLHDLNSNQLNELPSGFKEEMLNIVIPFVNQSQENEDKVEVSSKDDIYDLIPKEYFDELKPIDKDGKKVLSFSELKHAVDAHLFIEKPLESLNTNDNADLKREKLKASYIHDDYPFVAGLEHSWRILESDYECIEREKHPANDPISSFTYYVEMGFYPPPELLMIIEEGFETYFNLNGLVSLDEVFFGKKYKKTTSPAYKKHKYSKYSLFHTHVHFNKRKKKSDRLSLEQLMLEAIEDTDPITMAMLGFDQNIDIDTFLRGYRRWKKDVRDGKFD